MVVSGAGYVRILLDDDHDGVAESYQTFAEGPTNGQRRACSSTVPDLYCTGDGGIFDIATRTQTVRPTGPPECSCRCRQVANICATDPQGPGRLVVCLGREIRGSERSRCDVAIRQSSTHGPVVLMRLSPDFRIREVVADGFRNPYDFV